MIALVYFLIYLSNNRLPFLDRVTGAQQEFNKVQILKKLLTPEKLCARYNVPHLESFAEAVFALGYDDEPYYSKLRFMFQKNLMVSNQVPDNRINILITERVKQISAAQLVSI